MRNNPLLGPYSRAMPRDYGGPIGEGGFLKSEGEREGGREREREREMEREKGWARGTSSRLPSVLESSESGFQLE